MTTFLPNDTLASYARTAVDLKTRMHETAETEVTRMWLRAMTTDLSTPDDPPTGQFIDAVQRMISAAWKVGEPYVLAPAMTAIVAAAADALDLTGEVLTDDVAPSDYGALFLPETIYHRWPNGELTAIGAITWSKFTTRGGKPSWAVFGWSDRDDPAGPHANLNPEEGPKAREMLTRLGPYLFNHLGLIRIGTPIEAQAPLEVGERDRVWQPAPDGQYCIDAARSRTRACVAIAYAFWRIATQPLATVATAPLDRATRRRAARASITHHPRVVMLRRAKALNEPLDGNAKWHYRVRFLVRGHWRRLTDKHGRTYRIWIHSYVKGPDGAPLLTGEKVNILAR